MRRSLRAVLLTMFLSGCGADPPPTLAVGFVNHTRHSDADLWAIWTTAQQSLAEKVDLNPVQRANSNVLADILPGDPAALSAMPHKLLVAAEPDVTPEALLAATGVERASPTGLIACPQPCNVRFAPAYSRYRPPLTQYAASWEFAGNNFSTILEYEFENQILFALGYDMSWR